MAIIVTTIQDFQEQVLANHSFLEATDEMVWEFGGWKGWRREFFVIEKDGVLSLALATRCQRSRRRGTEERWWDRSM